MLKTVIDGTLYRAKSIWGGVNRAFYPNPQIMNTTESLKLILENKHSIARFGDGEFNLIRGVDLGFQKADTTLTNKLVEIFEQRVERLEIGIPDVFKGLNIMIRRQDFGEHTWGCTEGS